MRPSRRFQPACEAVEGRALLSGAPADHPLVLCALIGSGVNQLPSLAGSGLPMPVVPFGRYVEPGLDLRTAVPGTAHGNLAGWGAHDDMIGATYAEWLTLHGIAPHIVPLVAGDAHGLTSDAVGRCELWIAAEARRMNAEGLNTRWLAVLPYAPHPVGITEFYGRRALDAAGVPLIQASGDWGIDVSGSGLLYDRSPTAIVAGSADGLSNYGSYVTMASVAPGYASSGATAVAAAWLTATIEAHPNWPMAWDVIDVRARGVLPGP